MELWIGFCIALIWMMVGYLCYLFQKNPAIVDLFWTIAVALLGIFYYFQGDLHSIRSIIVLGFSLLWAFRLSSLLIVKFKRDRIDGRYERLNHAWKKKRQLKYLFFFILQAVAAFILSLPLYFSTQAEKKWTGIDTGAFIIVVLAWIGELVADYQLQAFINTKGKHEKVCNRGLWYYSRHPNYFFEWIFWIGQFLFALNAPMGWVSILSPLLLLITLLYFSGIPPAEEQAIKTKGEAYKHYQKTTSAFVPWFKKSS